MISFVYDNNAIEHLINSDDYSNVKKKLKYYFDRKMICCYLSEINFQEILKGVNESNFSRLQHIIIEAIDLTTPGSLLFQPYDHINISVKNTDTYFIITLLNKFGDALKSFCELKSYHEFTKIFSEYSQGLNDEIGKKHYETKNRLGSLYIPSEDIAEAKKILLSNDDETFFNKFLPAAIKSFDLEEQLLGKSLEAVIQVCPSLIYFIDLIRIQIYKNVFENKKEKESDFFDFQHLYYLDKCDYIISDDKKLCSLFYHPSAKFVNRRAISTEEFVQHLNKPMLLSRLP